MGPTWFSAAVVAGELARLRAAHARQNGVFSGFWFSAFVLPVLMALLTLLFLRHKPAVRGATVGSVP